MLQEVAITDVKAYSPPSYSLTPPTYFWDPWSWNQETHLRTSGVSSLSNFMLCPQEIQMSVFPYEAHKMPPDGCWIIASLVENKNCSRLLLDVMVKPCCLEVHLVYSRRQTTSGHSNGCTQLKSTHQRTRTKRPQLSQGFPQQAPPRPPVRPFFKAHSPFFCLWYSPTWVWALASPRQLEPYRASKTKWIPVGESAIPSTASRPAYAVEAEGDHTECFSD